MELSPKILSALTVLAALILSVAFASQSLWVWSILSVVFGLLCLASQGYGWGWPASIGLAYFIIASAGGVLVGIPAGWLLICVTAALLAWDLDYFIRRTRQADKIIDPSRLERKHLNRLMLIAGLGLIVGGLALTVRIEIKFGWTLFWGIVSVFALTRLIDAFSREGE